jgi:hypothetical protein
MQCRKPKQSINLINFIKLNNNNKNKFKNCLDMLCGNKSQQRYDIGAAIGNKIYKCNPVQGIFDLTQVSHEILYVHFVSNKLSLELHSLTSNKIVDYGTTSIEVSKKTGVAPGTNFMITKPHGPSLSQAMK